MTGMIVRRVVTARIALAMTVTTATRVTHVVLATTDPEPNATIAQGAIGKSTTVVQLAETAPIGLHAQSAHLAAIIHSTTA